MKHALLPLFLLCACAAPLTDADRAAMRTALPTYEAMTLARLQAVDTATLGKGELAAYKKALRAAKAEKRKQDRATRKRLSRVIKSYKHTNIERSGYDRNVWAYGRTLGSFLPDSSWYLASSFGPDGEHHEIIFTINYNNFNYSKYHDPNSQPPQITPQSWRDYNYATFWGGQRANISNSRMTDKGCTKMQCDFQETLWIDLPARKFLDTLEGGGSISLKVSSRSGNQAYINIPHDDVIGYLRRIHDDLGYYDKIVRHYWALHEPLPIKKR